MDSSQFREAAHAAIDEIINYYDTLADRRVVPSVEPGYLRPLLPAEAPRDGEPWPAIQADIDRVIMPGLTHWQSPNFMAFFPANASYPSMLGEMYSAAFTAPAFNWMCSPAVTELETVVLDWLAMALGLPDCYLSSREGGGVIQGSASEAIVTVMVAARERYFDAQTEGLNDDEKDRKISELRGKLVALGSDQSHSSTQKAAKIVGTRYRSITAPQSDDFALTGKALRHAIEDFKGQGLEPFYLTVTLGTTSTCAVDRFEEIAHVARDYPQIWIHVDAAYAGAALICEEYQHYAKHFEAFDSFDMNMHKWLLTNFDASCLFIKTRRHLTSAMSITPSYLRNSFSDSGLVTDYRDWQIPLGRRFRALKIWFVLRTFGVAGLQAYIQNHIKLGELFHALILTRPDLFTVLTGPAFALTVFTVVPGSENVCNKGGSDRGKISAAAHEMISHNEALPDGEKIDAADQTLVRANSVTKEVYELVNSQAEIYLTSTTIAGHYAIRVVNASPAAEEKYLRRAFEILVDAAETVLKREKKA